MAVHVRRRYAVLQALLLVLAAVGTTLTIAGPVAAAAEDLTVTNEGQKLQPRGNLTFEVTDDLGVQEDHVHVWIDSVANDRFDPGERNRTFNSSNGNTLDGAFENVGLPPGRYELMAVENATLTGGERPQSRANFTIDDTPPGLAGAVAFTETNGTQAYGEVGRTVVEVLFNESISDGSGGTAPVRGDIWIRLTNGTVLREVELNDNGPGDAGSDRRVVVFLGDDVGPADVNGVATAKAANFTDEAGNAVTFHSHDVKSATTTVAESGKNTSAFRGEIVAIVGDQDDEEVFMRSSSGDTIFNNTTSTSSKVYRWDSGGWPTAWNYRIFFDGRTNPNFLLPEDVGLALHDLELSAVSTKSQFSTEADVIATISANASNRTFEAALVDSSGEVIETTGGSLDGKSTRVNFGQRARGDYRIQVEDNVTGLIAKSRLFRVRPPEATATPTPSLTSTESPSSTPGLTLTPTTTPPSIATPTGTGGFTPVRTPFQIETPRPTATPEQTVIPATPTRVPTTPSSIPESSDGVGGIIQAVMEGVSAAIDELVDAFSGILP